MSREKCDDIKNYETNELVAIDFGGFTYDNIRAGAYTQSYISPYFKKQEAKGLDKTNFFEADELYSLVLSII